MKTKEDYENNSQICKIDCVFGIEGHCGKTQYEYLHHCELMLSQNKPQRRTMKTDMTKFKEMGVGQVGLVQLQENGRIVQIALTVEQSKLLQIFLAGLSQESKLIQMPKEYDLILKGELK